MCENKKTIGSKTNFTELDEGKYKTGNVMIHLCIVTHKMEWLLQGDVLSTFLKKTISHLALII